MADQLTALWWRDAVARRHFERGASDLTCHLTAHETSSRFEYRMWLPVEDVGTVQVRAWFDTDDPRHAEVATSPWRRLDPRYHPKDLPHRYDDDRLCLWYPRDRRDRRWEWEDGLRELLGHTGAHLMRERLWLRTGRWEGPELPHGWEEDWDHDPRRNR